MSCAFPKKWSLFFHQSRTLRDMTILEKQQFFSDCLSDFIRALRMLGMEVTLGEAWRSPETCELYAKDGRGIANSNHTNRLAIDLNLFRGSDLAPTSDYMAAGAIWKHYSKPGAICVWGGDFKSRDYGHFSIEHNGVQ